MAKAVYQTNVDLTSFGGINQSGDGYNMSMRYAQYAYNCDFDGGALAPARYGRPIEETIVDPIETLAVLHRRFTADDEEKDIMVAIAGGCVYTKLLDKPDRWMVRYRGLTNSKCDYVTYEVNPQNSEASVDVLLFTNADDGMFILYGDTLFVEPVATPKKFGCIARFYDRIWGSGITDDPDMLVYSAQYDPLDWNANEEIPEDGAGDLLQPSWDGDSFVALRSFGSYLLAFKKNAIWKIYGTNPGDFVIKEQYGAGSLVEDTIAINSSYAFMLGWNGLIRYDGTSAEPFQQDALRDVFSRMNTEYRDKSIAVMMGKKLIMAMPIDDSTVNNCVIQYHITDQCWSIITGIKPESFMAYNDRLFYTTAETPGQVCEFGKGEVMPAIWVGGYQDLGLKTSVKSAFTIYFMLEGEKKYVPITFRIRTEKKVKEKFLIAETGKSKSININNTGRFFRLEIVSKSKDWWRLVGGVQLHCELDPDF